MVLKKEKLRILESARNYDTDDYAVKEKHTI